MGPAFSPFRLSQPPGPKVLSTEIAIQATKELFELGGTRSTRAAHNLDRYWQNAGSHTL
jgi:alkylation response protein AidB-like acyl-CoA dehydrogenase